MRKNRKYFNVNGDCKPGMHYMVDLTGRLGLIKAMVEIGVKEHFLDGKTLIEAVV